MSALSTVAEYRLEVVGKIEEKCQQKFGVDPEQVYAGEISRTKGF